MARYYTVSFENVAVAAAQDFFELTPADDKPVLIAGLYLDNVGGVADAADAQEELLRISIVRGHTTSGSGGSTPTPQPMNSTIDTAAGFTVEANNTTIASTAGTTIGALGWNTRVPLREWFPEPFWFGASQANTTIVVRLLSTPADSFQCSGMLFVTEPY
jgi:hypothetical protein